MAPQESYHCHPPPLPLGLCRPLTQSVIVKKRLCACWLGILVTGTVAFGLVAYVGHHHKATVRAERSSTTNITGPELGRHDAPEDCWIVIHQTVYDVTEYAQHHPNPRFITLHCGLDVTSLYASVHDLPMLKIIQRRRVGMYHHLEMTDNGGENSSNEGSIVLDVDNDQDDDSNATSWLPEISIEELLLHRTPADCWMALYGTVYDVTEYAPYHPNPHFVTDYCGLEATQLFDGAHDQSVVRVVRQRGVGRLAEKETTNNANNATKEKSDSLLESPTNTTSGAVASSPVPTNLPTSRSNSAAPTKAPAFVDVSDTLQLLFGLSNSTSP